MTVRELKLYFQKELSNLYSQSEADILFEIFSEEILKLSKIELRMQLNSECRKSDEAKFSEVIDRLQNEIPYQYILGHAEFFGYRFKVSPDVLIPRPETEELLELAISKIEELVKLKGKKLKILDIGTGSGIIPVILKKHFPDAKISALDFSEKALDVARENSEIHQTEINFIHSDYLNNDLKENYDVIISNPPYIGLTEENEIEDSVKNIEPKLALFSPTADPLVFYRKIANDAEKYLSSNGLIFLEINQKLGTETLALFKKFSHSELLKDISGNDRFVLVCK